MKSTILAAMLCLSACAQGTGPTPKASVLALETGLTQADRLAMNYVSLPRCTSSGSTVCSDGAMVSKIKAAGQKAYDAVTSAQSVVDSQPSGSQADAAVADAGAALAAFQATIPGENAQ